MKKTIWISAAEASGDIHGAKLLQALQSQAPTWSFIGMGGAELRQAGLQTFFRAEDLSVMGITEVVGHLPKILSMLKSIKAELAKAKPDALVVIDAPDFHFHIIKAAHKLNIPVYYYISPKIWAWRQNRALFIKKHVRRVLSILPFEKEFYQKFGMNIDYIGNPLVDMVDYPSLASIQPEDGLIGFLPGSRQKEIKSLLPEFGKAAKILQSHRQDLRFMVIKAPNIDLNQLQALWPQDVPVDFQSPESRWQLMRRCEVLIAASGTVTLESALVGTPTIATYKVSPFSFAVGKALVKIPYISLANLILNKEVFPELLQEKCDSKPLATQAMQWLDPKTGKTKLTQVRLELDRLRDIMGEKGAPARAASLIFSDLQGNL